MVARSSLTRRQCISLLEVLVSLAIFLISYFAIWHLVMMAGDRALDTQDLSRAGDIAQSVMDQTAAGILPLQAQGDTPFDDGPDFNYSMTADQGSVTGLWNV